MKRYQDFKQQTEITAIDSYSAKYFNNQIMVGYGDRSREDKIKIGADLVNTILRKLQILCVPDEDIKANYIKLILTFANWMIGETIFDITKEKNTTSIANENDLLNIDYHKGWYLYGSTGVGKTTFLDACSLAIDELNRKYAAIIYSHKSKYQFCLAKVRANQITRNFRIGGDLGLYSSDGQIIDGGIDQFSAITSTRGRKSCTSLDTTSGDITCAKPGYGSYPVLYIDDFAWGKTASETKSYGNSINVLDEILKNRYDNNLLTFVTSNVKPSADAAVIDRAKSMFNVICINDTSSHRA